MKILILGCGMQGRVVAKDLKNSYPGITVIDIDENNLKKLHYPGIKRIQFDVRDRKRLVRLMSDYELIIGALPARFGFYSMECAIEAGVDMVDMSYSAEDPFLLDKEAKKARIKIIPDAGYAPGLSNILTGEGYQELKRVDHLKIMVGGIPEDPIPPFNYRITWSPSDLIEEYTRPARIYRNYRIVTVPALSGVEEFYLPGVGRLEAFYTDGLRTLLKTMQKIKNMEEKTIRYAGHSTIFKTLIDCGFFSDERVVINGKDVICADFSFHYLKKVLSKGPEYDITILLIELKGPGGVRKYRIIDHYDRRNKITSMARMTAYSCAVIARCIKDYPEFGIIPPEYLGMKREFCSFIKGELKKRRIRLQTPA
jgi:saccharopine dehydrogenase-like NADP-dependent oxidoreductase